MDFKIMEGKKEDYKEICTLILEVHKLHFEKRPDVYLDIDNPLQKEDYYQLLNDDKIKVFIVKNDKNRLLAYSIVNILNTKSPIYISKNYTYIDDFCVKSEYRRSGVGKMLFKHILDYGKANGVTSVQLNVWEFNDSAIKFYEAMGMATRNRRMEIDLSES